MILVDTSVWVGYLRGTSEALAETLEALLAEETIGLPAPVKLELLGGASAAALPQIRRALEGLPTIYPSRDTWSLAERMVERAVARGERFGLGDLLLGAIAAERGGRIWSLDGDFARMASLGLIKLFTPPRAYSRGD